MKIQLSDSFDYKRLLRFSLPSIMMMIFTSVYGVVDGFFVSNYAGKMPFAALNLIYPFIMILGTLGFMFGAGGSALIGKTLGEGDIRRANEYFSLFVYFPAACGAAVAVLAFIFLPDVARLLGAEGELLRDCVIYGRILLLALPALNLEFAFSSFCVTAARPKLALGVSVAAGVTNMALDALFVAVFHWGLAG
ncbi:MAG: MATE family efflux transporter, partial [Butyricicoccus sp.]|nr:MATE family efflux transporter [Butyricicoccus sp.]